MKQALAFSKILFNILIIFILVFPGISQGNKQAEFNVQRIQNFTDEQGLSSRFGFCMLQDHEGFIWFGTQIGLNRYDGYDIVSFVTDNSDPGSLPHNQIWSIYEDRSRELWICTEGGLSRYDRTTRSFSNLYPDPENPLAPDNSIYSIKEDSGGLFWIFTKAGLYSFDKETKTFTSFKEENILSSWSSNKEKIIGNELRFLEDRTGRLWMASMDGLKIYDHPGPFQCISCKPDDPLNLSSNNVSSVIEDGFGNIWISTFGGGLNRYDRESGQIEHYRFRKGNSKSLISDYILPLYLDSSGRLWIGGRDGFSLYNAETDDFTSYRISSSRPDVSDQINRIAEDSSGKLWLATSHSGVYCFDPATQSLLNYRNDPKNKHSLSSDDVLNIYIDRSNAVWVITEGGFSKIDFASPPFRHIKSNPFIDNTLTHNNVRSFCKDRSGNLWIATLGGGVNKIVSRSDGTEVFVHYRHEPGNKNSLSEDNVYVVYEDRDGIMWFGTYRNGLNRFDPKTGEFTRFMHDPDKPHSIAKGRIRAIYEDSQGVFWIGLQNGLNTMDRSSGEFIHYHADPLDETSLPNEYVQAFFEDEEEVLWLGTFFGGLCRYNRDSDNFKVYQNEPGNIQSLSDNCVRQIHEDRDGRFWIGTMEGLNLFDRDTETFTLFSKRDGFPGEYLKGLLEDEQGNLWISSNRGISKFNYEKGSILNYDMHDGVQGFEFNLNSYYRAESSEMYFGGFNGFNVFNPGELNKNTYVPPIVITDIKVFRKSVTSPDFPLLENSIGDTEVLELRHNQNFLSFDFASLNFTNTPKNQYKFMMTGIDPDTVYAGTRRSADYPDMKPGKYTFWVSGSNNDGVWNEEGLTMDIVIHPHFMKTRLAYLLYLIAFAIIVYLIFKWRIDIRDKSILETQVAERTRQIFNQKDKLQEQKEELHAILENLKTTQSQLLQAEKMASLGQLVAGIAHEINNPVTFISAGVESLEMNINDVREVLDTFHTITPGNAREKLEEIEALKERIEYDIAIDEIKTLIDSIKSGTARTTEIVNGLRTFSRLDEDVLKFANVHDGLDSTLVLLRNKFKERIKIEYQYGDIPLIECYPGQLNQVFMNILSNAVAAIENEGIIRISTSESDGLVRISIRDNGPGIPEEILPKIFDPFFTTKNVGEGTGLGLSITHGIIEKHKGSITASSEPGKGTEFIIVIPVQQNK